MGHQLETLLYVHQSSRGSHCPLPLPPRTPGNQRLIGLHSMCMGPHIPRPGGLVSQPISSNCSSKPLREKTFCVFRETFMKICVDKPTKFHHASPVTTCSTHLHNIFPSLFPLTLSLLLPLGSLDNGAPVHGLHSSPGTPHILTHSHTLVRGWRVQQLYKRSAIIGREILSLSSTTHPLVPRRLLASCADSAVRLVCPVGGHVITTALLPPGQRVLSLIHFPLTGEQHTLWNLFWFHDL